MAALHSMAHRLTSIPLSAKRYEAETNRIIEIGIINGYPESTIRNVINRHEIKKRQLDSSVLFTNPKDAETKRVVIPYLLDVNNHLSRMYRDCGFQVVNSNTHSVQKLIGSAKDKIPDLLKSGIYEVGCQDGCEYKYLGKSERNPTIRYDEHDYCFVKADFKSAVARHLIENGHETDISKVRLVQPVNGRNTCAFECYEKIHIIRGRRNGLLMNQNDGNVNSILFDLI